MVAEHVAEHIEAGMLDALEVLAAMQARPCYALVTFTPTFIAQQMRLLTKDTTTIARAIAKARSSRMMLEVIETGDAKDKIQVLRGIQVLGDVVEHKGDVTTTVKHVYEDTAPKLPAREGE